MAPKLNALIREALWFLLFSSQKQACFPSATVKFHKLWFGKVSMSSTYMLFVTLDLMLIKEHHLNRNNCTSSFEVLCLSGNSVRNWTTGVWQQNIIRLLKYNIKWWACLTLVEVLSIPSYSSVWSNEIFSFHLRALLSLRSLCTDFKLSRWYWLKQRKACNCISKEPVRNDMKLK